MVQLRNVLGGLKVEQAYSRQAQTLDPNSPLREAVDRTLRTFQADFPVCDGDRLVGFLTHKRLVEGLDRYGPEVPINRVMSTEVNPVSPDEELIAVQRLFAENTIDAAPVVEAGRFLGLITNRDINEVYRLVSSQPNLIAAGTSREVDHARIKRFASPPPSEPDQKEVPPASLPRQ